MFLALQRNWPWLKDTVFNEFGSSQWRHSGGGFKAEPEAPVASEGPSGADLTVEKLNENFHYSPKHSNSGVFDFDFDFGGRNFVEIDRHTLKHGRTALDINSNHDVNRLEPGAEKIQADTESAPAAVSDATAGQSGDNSGSAPPDLPQ